MRSGWNLAILSRWGVGIGIAVSAEFRDEAVAGLSAGAIRAGVPDLEREARGNFAPSWDYGSKRLRRGGCDGVGDGDD
jgi:hypothetical protein